MPETTKPARATATGRRSSGGSPPRSEKSAGATAAGRGPERPAATRPARAKPGPVGGRAQPGEPRLLDPSTLSEVVKRLRRAQGQIGGVVQMIEAGRSCSEVLTQIAAASRAIDRAGFKLVASGLRQCIAGDMAAAGDGGAGEARGATSGGPHAGAPTAASASGAGNGAHGRRVPSEEQLERLFMSLA
jgi:DNA-binding FrmR family transcriptional regulator